MKKDTLLRTILLLVSLSNKLLAIFGKETLPFTEAEVYQAFSACLTVISSLIAWWKNNSFTENAILADDYLKALKERRHG